MFESAVIASGENCKCLSLRAKRSNLLLTGRGLQIHLHQSKRLLRYARNDRVYRLFQINNNIKDMINFNFQEHFEKLKKAPDRLSESYVERDWFVYYDSLSKDDQKEFKAAFDNYLHGKNEIYSEQIAIGKQMMMDAGIPIS